MKYDNEHTAARGRPIPSSGAFAAADNSFGINVLPAGVRLSDFEIVKLIGDSGFDIAYLAYDHALDCHVRLKEYLPSGIAVRTRAMHVTVTAPSYAEPFHAGMQRFLDEAHLLAQLDCPALIKVDSVWEANGVAYAAMPFHAGITLRQAVEERRIVADEAWVRQLLADLLDAVETLHRARSLHLDISADSILLLDDGRALLLEPGAARRLISDLRHGRGAMRKPGFAAIEQYADTAGFTQGAWTDVHAIAAVAYFLVAGKPPPAAVARMVNDEMAPARMAGKGRYGEALLSTLDRGLAVRPEQRFQSVAALREALGVGAAPSRALPRHAGAAAPVAGPDSAQAAHPPVRQEWLQAMMAEESMRKNGHARSKPLLLAGWLLAGALAGASAYWLVHSPQGAPGQAERAETARSASPSSGPGPLSPSGGNGINPEERPYGGESAAAEPRLPATAAAEPPAMPPPEATPPAAVPPAAAAPVPVPTPAPSMSPEEDMWKSVTASDEAGAYERYLKRYPAGRFAATAKSRLERIRSRTAAAAPRELPASPEEMAWKTAVAINQGPAYESYLNGFPRGPNAAAAREQLARIRAAETARLAAAAAKPQAPVLAPAAPAAPAAAAVEPAANPAEPSVPPAPAPAAASRPAPRVDEARPLPDPGQPAGRKTLGLAGLTMTGDFTTDPATGLATGRIRIDWNNGDRFDGNLVRGRKEGKGRFTWSNGQTYSGDWSNDQPNGRGTFLFANGNRYDGEVRDGLPHGEGTTRFRGGDIYSGSWARGRANGHGRYTWINGGYWEGEFRNDMRTENGKLVYSEKALPAPNAASADPFMNGATGTPPQRTAGNN